MPDFGFFKNALFGAKVHFLHVDSQIDTPLCATIRVPLEIQVYF